MKFDYSITRKESNNVGWIKNLSIQKKLLLIIGVVILCLFFVIYSSLNGISSIGASQKNLFEVEYPTTLNLTKLSIDLARERFALRRMLVATSNSEKVSWHQEIMELKNDISEKSTVIMKLSQSLPQIHKYLNEFIVLRDSFLIIRDKQIIPAIYESNKGVGVSDNLIEQQNNMSEKMRNKIFLASTLSEEHDSLIMEDSKRELSNLRLILIVVGIIAVLFAILSSIYLVRIIANPLKELSKLSEKVAYGDLSLKIPPLIRNDEVGALWLSFSMMVGTLQSVTKETNQLVEELSIHMNAISEEQDQTTLKETITTIKEKIEKLGRLMGEYKL